MVPEADELNGASSRGSQTRRKSRIPFRVGHRRATVPVLVKSLLNPESPDDERVLYQHPFVALTMNGCQNPVEPMKSSITNAPSS
jgi:hypothetical protein